MLQGVHTYIGAYHILHGVDFDVPRGQVTMLLGRNGAGKTTTLRTIMGLWKVKQGHIVFDDYEEDDYEEGLPGSELSDAISRLDFESRFFGELLEDLNDELEEAFTRDVLALTARLCDVLWNEESRETVQPFGELMAAALSTVKRVQEELEDLKEPAGHVIKALEELKVAWEKV